METSPRGRKREGILLQSLPPACGSGGGGLRGPALEIPVILLTWRRTNLRSGDDVSVLLHLPLLKRNRRKRASIYVP